MIKQIFAMLFMMLFSLSVFASPASFEKRFKITRDNNGKLLAIEDRFLTFKFEIKPYLEHLKDHIKKEQIRLNEKSDYSEFVREVFGESHNVASEGDMKLIIDSLEALKNVDVDKIFDNYNFKRVINTYENKLSSALLNISPLVLSAPNSPRFFYRRNATYQVVRWGLNFAKKSLSTVPLLNTASYVIVQVEKLIRERRLFHQNMLLHYFENYDAKELGLTKAEVDFAYSSVYESRIPWFAIWESNNAVTNWYKYGATKFYANVRVANSKLRASRPMYTKFMNRPNYAFQTVEYKEEKVIVNLYDGQHMFNTMPAIAFNYDKPNQVLMQRTLLQLAELGLSFVTLPGFVKSLAYNFIKSFYDKQRITEGALVGYFESVSDHEMVKILMQQQVNPFENF